MHRTETEITVCEHHASPPPPLKSMHEETIHHAAQPLYKTNCGLYFSIIIPTFSKLTIYFFSPDSSTAPPHESVILHLVLACDPGTAAALYSTSLLIPSTIHPWV